MLYGETIFAGSFVLCYRALLTDWCSRHLSFVRHAFSGIPTLIQDKVMHNDNVSEVTDIL